jgi:hypothetical protein
MISGMRTLIAEDLLVLLIEGSWEARRTRPGARTALAAAVLLELAAHGRLDIDDGPPYHRLFVATNEPVGHVVLDDALARVGTAEGSRIKEVLGLFLDDLHVRLLDALTEQGIVARFTRRRWLVPRITWQLEDSTHREELRARLGGILTAGLDPDERSRNLISLLCKIRAIGEVVDKSDKQLATTRADEVADGGWPEDGVAKAIVEACGHAFHADNGITPGAG